MRHGMTQAKPRRHRLQPVREIDPSESIDSQPLHPFQYRVFLICLLCLLADGFDAQALGYVVPSISKQWGIPPSAFAQAFTAGLFGMGIGALLLGTYADYLGRRKIILVCNAVTGLSMIAMSFASGMSALVILRFVAGLALGGLMPNAMALGAEFSPARLRSTVVTIISCGISLGSACGGITAGALLKTHGWPSVFRIGGAIPLALAVLGLWHIPESIRFLALRNKNPAQLASLMRHVCPALRQAPHSRFVIAEEKPVGPTAGHLFTEGRALTTVLIWVIYFMCLLEIYFVASWLPTLLNQAGMSLTWSVYATSSLQVAGTIAIFGVGVLLARFNPGRVLAALYLIGTVAIAGIAMTLQTPYALLIATSCAGVGIVGGQAATHAIASRAYPTFMRSTGMGWGLGIGRIGSLIGPTVGGLLLAMNWPAQDLLYAGALPPLLAALAAFGLSLILTRAASDSAPALAGNSRPKPPYPVS
jgi:MFS transporter, AAHS family, 4-hydroxybenzoate transporter